MGFIKIRTRDLFARTAAVPKPGEKGRFLFLLLVMTIVAISIMSIIMAVLYNFSVDEIEKRLSETAKSHSKLIASIGSFNLKNNADYPGGAMAATLLELRESLIPRHGSFELTIAKRDADKLLFILRQNSTRLYQPSPIPFSSPLAEPMRRAISGFSGTWVGLDYRNKKVLATYESVSMFGLGIVIKVDLDEIRAPFIRAALIAGSISIVIILAGILIFYRVSNHIIQKISDNEHNNQLIIENAPFCILQINLDGRLISMNPEGLSMMGVSNEKDVIGMKCLDICGKEDFTSLQPSLQPLLNAAFDGETSSFEFKSVNDRLLYTSLIPIKDSAGKITRLMGISQDITERKHAEETLKKNQQLLKNSQELAHVGSWEYDFVEHNLTWSEEIFRMLGLPTGESKANYDAYIELVHPDDRSLVENSFYGSVREGRDRFEVEYRIIRQDNGELRNIHEKCEHLRDHSGKVICSTGMLQDITERTQIEEKLRRVQKMDALGKLTGGIAHDYNNMLNVILGYSQVLSAKFSEESDDGAKVNKIIRAVKRSRELTSKLLDFSRLHPEAAENVDVNELLQDMKQLLEKTLTPIIAYELIHSDELLTIQINRGDFEDALVNLTINAIHAMPDGGVFSIESKSCVVNAANASYLSIPEGRYLKLCVSDDGVGFDKKIQTKIFDPFFTTKGEQGTGLGLSQVYSFISRSCGTIEVESEVGVGTKFTIYLPLVNSHPDAIIVNTEELELDELHGNSELILVVDDESSLRELVCEILESFNYRVITAENGEQALRLLESEKVDLVFSDVLMPKMNGYDLYKNINNLYPTLPFQLTSGFAESQKKVEGLSVMMKPYDVDVLLSCIKNLLHSNKELNHLT